MSKLLVGGIVLFIIVSLSVVVYVVSTKSSSVSSSTMSPTMSSTMTPSSTPDNGCVQSWSRSNTDGSNLTGPFSGCTKTSDSTTPWCMKRVYVSGGTEGVHWKYTTDANDPQCMTNWTWVAQDGTVKGGPYNRVAQDGSKMWCGLPVYRNNSGNSGWQNCYDIKF